MQFNIQNILKQHQNTHNLNDPNAIRLQTQQILAGMTGKTSKDAESDILLQKYRDAKDNVRNAPERLNDAEKNYFRFVNGQTWWDNFVKTKRNKKIQSKLKSQDEKFIEKYNSIKKSILYYKSQYENSENMSELIDNMDGEIGDYTKNFSEKEKKVQTSYRKSTYYDRDIKDIESVTSALTTLYIIAVLTYSISSLFIFGHLKDPKTWATVAGLIIYPFIIVKIHLFINKMFKSVFINVNNLDKKMISP